ncbi:hypothetical protein [Streptomyces sp. NPDC003077]
MPGQSGFDVEQDGMAAEARKLDTASDEVGDIAKAVADGCVQLPR